jgi:hypothetical protein
MSKGNQLSPAQVERLVKLQEEMNEAGKELCKILNHGYVAVAPDGVRYDNKAALERELGDVCAAIKLLGDRGDIDDHQIYLAATAKDATITRYMHHQGTVSDQERAWNLLCADTRNGMHQFDWWGDVPVEMQNRYLNRVLEERRG